MTTVSAAVAKQETGAMAQVEMYRPDIALVLPTFVRPEQFTRIVIGVLRRNAEVRKVAENNFGSFMAAVLDCARQGLEPGDTYHFVVFGSEIVGITDWTGEVEKIYRAGGVSSVKAEIVRANDTFRFDPSMEVPEHTVDWFGDRGEMIGVYAYARMKDGGTSRVVVYSRADIEKIRAVSRSGKSPSSPWVKWPERMWLKTVVKQLAKWVPSSAEYRQQMQQSTAQAINVAHARDLPVLPSNDLPAPAADPDTGEVVDGELLPADDPMAYDELTAEERAGATT